MDEGAKFFGAVLLGLAAGVAVGRASVDGPGVRREAYQDGVDAGNADALEIVRPWLDWPKLRSAASAPSYRGSRKLEAERVLGRYGVHS